MTIKEQTYLKSNKEVAVCYNSFVKDYYLKLKKVGDDLEKREQIAQELCDYLSKKFKIPKVRVCVMAINQPNTVSRDNRLTSKTFGTYTLGVKLITIYGLTAKQKKIVSTDVFFDTLIHEYMHHYDRFKLGLTDSYHTKGFYLRLSDLISKLKK